MDAEARAALETDKVIEITTYGRRTGRPHRIEMWFHRVGGQIYLTGDPGPRDWYANLVVDGRMIVHLKESTAADLPARGIVLTDTEDRRPVFEVISGREPDRRPFDVYLAGSPLVRVEFSRRAEPSE